MLYSDLAETFDRLESTGSRLEMTSILAEFFRRADKGELRSIVYLSQGKLHPDFVPGVLGMADRLVMKAIAKASGNPDDKVEKLTIETGDMGQVAETMISRKKQMALFSEELTVARVVRGLTTIENADGKDSQDTKQKTLAGLLHDSGPLEARYLCRTVTGRMRVGAADMTILDALAEAFATKEDRPAIERAFNVTCDIGLVAETIANHARGEAAFHIRGRREDGRQMRYGVQVRRNQGPGPHWQGLRQAVLQEAGGPDLQLPRHRRGPGHDEAIIEGECVAIDPETGFMLPFQNVTHRRKKHGMDEAVRDVPVRIFMFDMLYADGEDWTPRPYLERRAALEEGFEIGDNVQMTTMRMVGSPEEGEEFFANAIGARCEGIMAKSVAPDSVYRAGSRGFLWIKYKKDYQQALTDSFDLVVVGAFYGMGKRAGRYGALLMAAYDGETGRFETVCKLGTGFDDAFLDAMPALLDGSLSESKPSSVDAEMVPDVWFEPNVVLEVVAAEITLSPIHTAAKDVLKEGAGLGIRFPRFTGRVRDDKTPEQCTSVSEIIEMFEMQVHDSDGLSE